MDTKQYYLDLLRKKAEETGRLPRKSDFSAQDVNKIKGLFGPWPWALEQAGLKESKQEERLRKNREKRAAAREKRKKNEPSCCPDA